MADDFTNPTQLCRICFGSGEYNLLSHQLQIDEQNYELKDIFMELSSLETWNMENVPSMICTPCTDQLGQCFMFIRKIKAADERIKNIVTVEEDTDEEEVVADNDEYNYEDDDDNFSLIEYVSEKHVYEMNEEEDYSSSLQYIEEKEAEPEVSDRTSPVIEKKRQKRKGQNFKTPHFVLTENVSNILTHVNKVSDDELSNSEDVEQPPAKVSKVASEVNSFLITKFVPAPATLIADYPMDSNQIDGVDNPNGVNQVRMLDIAAVEVDATKGKIELDEGDDESNIENPNTMYACQYCPRAFSTSYHLIMHQRKSHICQFCMKSFSKVVDLHKHTRESHNQFNCALCKRDFSSNSNLRQHMRRVHNVELPPHVSLLSIKNK